MTEPRSVPDEGDPVPVRPDGYTPAEDEGDDPDILDDAVASDGDEDDTGEEEDEG